MTMSGSAQLASSTHGHQSTQTGVYEVFNDGGPSPISGLRFPVTQGESYSVKATVVAHLYSEVATRGGLMIEVSGDDGQSWLPALTSPLTGVHPVPGDNTSSSKTSLVTATFSIHSIPVSGLYVHVRVKAMTERLGGTFYRCLLNADLGPEETQGFPYQ